MSQEQVGVSVDSGAFEVPNRVIFRHRKQRFDMYLDGTLESYDQKMFLDLQPLTKRIDLPVYCQPFIRELFNSTWHGQCCIRTPWNLPFQIFYGPVNVELLSRKQRPFPLEHPWLQARSFSGFPADKVVGIVLGNDPKWYETRTKYLHDVEIIRPEQLQICSIEDIDRDTTNQFERVIAHAIRYLQLYVYEQPTNKPILGVIQIEIGNANLHLTWLYVCHVSLIIIDFHRLRLGLKKDYSMPPLHDAIEVAVKNVLSITLTHKNAHQVQYASTGLIFIILSLWSPHLILLMHKHLCSLWQFLTNGIISEMMSQTIWDDIELAITMFQIQAIKRNNNS